VVAVSRSDLVGVVLLVLWFECAVEESEIFSSRSDERVSGLGAPWWVMACVAIAAGFSIMADAVRCLLINWI